MCENKGIIGADDKLIHLELFRVLKGVRDYDENDIQFEGYLAYVKALVTGYLSGKSDKEVILVGRASAVMLLHFMENTSDGFLEGDVYKVRNILPPLLVMISEASKISKLGVSENKYWCLFGAEVVDYYTFSDEAYSGINQIFLSINQGSCLWAFEEILRTK